MSYLRVPVLAIRRHPLARVQVFGVAVPTGSRTHPWPYAGIPSGIQTART
jgi:alpha-D-ribose 1-methylphosphonate 5-phosphate C-P lyase